MALSRAIAGVTSRDPLRVRLKMRQQGRRYDKPTGRANVAQPELAALPVITKIQSHSKAEAIAAELAKTE